MTNYHELAKTNGDLRDKLIELEEHLQEEQAEITTLKAMVEAQKTQIAELQKLEAEADRLSTAEWPLVVETENRAVTVYMSTHDSVSGLPDSDTKMAKVSVGKQGTTSGAAPDDDLGQLQGTVVPEIVAPVHSSVDHTETTWPPQGQDNCSNSKSMDTNTSQYTLRQVASTFTRPLGCVLIDHNNARLRTFPNCLKTDRRDVVIAIKFQSVVFHPNHTHSWLIPRSRHGRLWKVTHLAKMSHR